MQSKAEKITIRRDERHLQQEQLRTIFKAYDVRGRTDTGELTPEIMQHIGSVFASQVNEESIVVGHDCRLTSEVLMAAFVAGITGEGKNVFNLGLTTTDTLYYATVQQKIAGAMITASHNPAHYNGVKLCKAGAMPFSSGELEAFRDGIPTKTNGGKRGRVENIDVLPSYIEHLASIIATTEAWKKLRIAADGSNGMAGIALEQIFSRTPAELIGIHMQPDGRFPNHPADPSHSENLQDLIQLIERESPDLGVIFDGDADRAVFIDDKGQPLPGGTAIALVASWYLTKRAPGSTIVYDSICPHQTPRIIEQYGGRAIRSRVGTPFVRQTMLEANANFAGETSGHFYFKENFAIDSGLLTMLVMMQILSETDVPLSSLRKQFEGHAVYQAVTFPILAGEKTLLAVADAFRDKGQLDFFDGLIVNLPDKWFSLRSSNTEPLIRLHAEAQSTESLEEIISEVADIIRQLQ